LNSGKPLGTGCCEWLWSIATWANGTLSNFSISARFAMNVSHVTWGSIIWLSLLSLKRTKENIVPTHIPISKYL